MNHRRDVRKLTAVLLFDQLCEKRAVLGVVPRTSSLIVLASMTQLSDHSEPCGPATGCSQKDCVRYGKHRPGRAMP